MPSIPPPTATETACPKCGVFKKSGRPSCCAPGGAWFQNCGGLGDKNVGHSWSEGVDACERKLYADDMHMPDRTVSCKGFPFVSLTHVNACK